MTPFFVSVRQSTCFQKAFPSSRTDEAKGQFNNEDEVEWLFSYEGFTFLLRSI